MLYLDFYNHIILVKCNEEDITKKLESEFHYFMAPTRDASLSIAPHFEIELRKAPPAELPSMVAVKILEHAAVYQLGTRQYVDYFGEALSIHDEDKIKITSMDNDRLFELAFLAVHSVLGQKLDQAKLCRIHALAVSTHNTNAIVMLPSKGGKSTLLKNLLDNPEVKIISDDMPLCNQKGEILSFPSKISLSSVPESGILSKLTWHEFKRHHYPPKWTASLAELTDRIDKNSQNHQNILIAGFRLSSGQSILSEVPKWKMIMPLMEHMIFGLGLPQILEFFLKFNFSDFIKLPYHAALRTVCAVSLLKRSKCYYFYMGPDTSYNAQLLLDLMYGHENT